VRQVGPAIYNVYLLSRLRARVGAIERARMARDLHDGVIQSLIGLEMQIAALRREAIELRRAPRPDRSRLSGGGNDRARSVAIRVSPIGLSDIPRPHHFREASPTSRRLKN
jgi:hypothetical protein